MHQKITLNEVKNSAFLADQAYKSFPNSSEKTIINLATNTISKAIDQAEAFYKAFDQTSSKEITNLAINSIFKIIDQIRSKDIAMAAPATNFSKFNHQITNSSKAKDQNSSKEIITNLAENSSSKDQNSSKEIITNLATNSSSKDQISSKEIITNPATNSSYKDQISSKDIAMAAPATNSSFGSSFGFIDQISSKEIITNPATNSSFGSISKAIDQIISKDINDKDIALAAFSGKMAFMGTMADQAHLITNIGKKVPVVGTFFTAIDAVVSGFFDKKGNPDKSYLDVAGTLATAYAFSKGFAVAGGFVGGPVGAVIGATVGAIIGSIYASDTFDALKSFHDELVTNLGDFAVEGHSLGGAALNISLFDPIALDLNNNGKIDTLSLENGVFFDHNGDKVAFKSSWVNSSDGILVRDIDGDGKITSGAELFGNFTKLKNGELAKNGAEALKDLDDNNDGLFDSNDKAFNEILVWQDFNSDGKA
ncbi:MAG: hypothetical protein SPE49_05925, partial [Campylobacter sp.]|nr:hypothetical protein [Campylobacter sp.]